MSDDLHKRLADFLGVKGVRYFQLLHKFHDGIPLAVRVRRDKHPMGVHAIHFNEGMQIRNWLRRQPECEKWTDHGFDDLYISVLCEAINRENKTGKQK